MVKRYINKSLIWSISLRSAALLFFWYISSGIINNGEKYFLNFSLIQTFATLLDGIALLWICWKKENGMRKSLGNVIKGTIGTIVRFSHTKNRIRTCEKWWKMSENICQKYLMLRRFDRLNWESRLETTTTFPQIEIIQRIFFWFPFHNLSD